MIDFSKVTGIRLPEGNVVQIADQNGLILWTLYYSEGLYFAKVNGTTYAVVGIGTCTDTNIVIPASYNNSQVTSIYKSAFIFLPITSVTIPGSVTNIGVDAFSCCENLKSVTLGNGVIFIENVAFQSCKSLESITIPDSVKSIGNGVFRGCTSLKGIIIPKSVTSIGRDTFEDCDSLESIAVPFVGTTKDGTEMTHFGSIFGAESYSLNDDYVPSSLKTVVITGGTSISTNAFANCSSLESITIPESVTSIGDSAFFQCYGLKSINIPDNVTSIGEWAFYNCGGLTSITIPKSVTSIGNNAFRECESLTIYCEAKSKPEGWDSNWNPSNRPVFWNSAM